MRCFVPLLTIVAVVLAMLAPKMSAAAAELMPGTLRVVVICSGASMQTIVMNASGEVVEIAETGPCIAADLPEAAGPARAWIDLQLAEHPDTRAAHLVALTAPLEHRPPGRAPPKSV